MIIVGINSYFEHPSVAVVCDGEVRFAVEDERFTGIKHGRKYSPYRTYVPVDALYAALRGCGATAADVAEIAYSYHRWDHLTSLWGCFTGRRLSTFAEEMAAFVSLVHVHGALRSGYEIPLRYRGVLDPGALGRVPYREWNHHLSHAASAFFCSGYDEALVVVADGAGEKWATSVYAGRGARLRRLASVPIPHSLGILYSMVTRHLGFEPFSDEFKVMGMAAYGEPRHDGAFERLLGLRPRGRYHVDAGALRALEPLLGPARLPGDALQQRHMDLAASLQKRLEEALEHVVVHHLRTTGLRRVCLAGGTFMNCVANGRLARLAEVGEVFVQPAAHDAGTAVGAAALSWIRRGGAPQLRFGSAALGTAHENHAIRTVLEESGIPYRRLDEPALIAEVARRLAGGQVGGVFRGRMEFGSRALGMRSILASPVDPHMRDRLNLLKGREEFRPVAPIVVAESFDRFFDGHRNRYMLYTAVAREEAKRLVPSAVHADGTARVQTVWKEHDPFLHALLRRFESLAGVPVLINTSLNVRGRPIVETPHDALACLFTTGMDFLVLESYLLQKGPADDPAADEPSMLLEPAADEYQAR